MQDLLALGLRELGVEAGFACVKPGRFPALRRAADAPLFEVRMASRVDLRTAWRVAQIVQRQQYHLIHAHTPRTAMIGRLATALVGVPLVYHVHSPAWRDTTRPWNNCVNGLIEWASLCGAAHVITVSASLRRRMERQGVARSRLSVVHNGVPSPAELPNRALPRPPWTLGTVALFRPRKGVEVLLEALGLLEREGIPVRLRAVGPFETSQYESQLKTLAARLGIGHLVCWTGFSSDVQLELAQMDVFVLPSLFGEGLPMVVLEAMAAGVPVVASAVEGVPEVIRHGIDGLLAKPGDAADLARAVADVVRGRADWSRLRAQAHQRQAEHFSDRSMAAGVAAVYRKVLARSEARSRTI